jgi:hypothetical protein
MRGLKPHLRLRRSKALYASNLSLRWLGLGLKANRRITNIEPQPATSSAVSNFEGWFRSAQSFLKLSEYIPSTFDIHDSIFDIRFLINPVNDIIPKTNPEYSM